MSAPQECPETFATPEPEHPRLAVAILCAAGIVVSLMQTIIVPLIPALPDILHAQSRSDTSWAMTITILVGAVTTPIAGRLGDMYGKRRILLGNMAGVAVGSAVCALSESLVPFLIGRGLQGLGFGTIAIGISVMRDIVPASRLGSSVGAMSASLGVGSALGLPFAALLAEYANWHALFWVSMVTALAAGLGIRLVIAESGHRSGGRFDVLGSIGLAVVLVCLLLPLSKASDWGWADARTIGLLVAALIIGALWCLYELRRRNPLVDLRVTGSRPVMLTNIASVATGFAFFSMQLIPIQILMAPTITENGAGLGMFVASLILAPSGLVMFACSHLSARITATHGPRVSLAIGSVVIAFSYVVFIVAIVAGSSMPWWVILVVSLLIGAGIGVSYSAMPALIMRTVRVEQTGEANGVNALARIVGTSMSSATVGMILTGMVVTTALPGGGSVTVPSDAGYLFASAISLGAALLAAVIAMAIPGRAPIIEEPV